MGKWDKLPNEVMQQIIYALGVKEKLGVSQWMTLNKQWFDMYQYILYKDITIYFGPFNDKIVDNIMNSRFDPGKYVKYISFESLDTPATYEEAIDLNKDSLHLFIKDAHLFKMCASATN
jgi:hypothetical protein